MLALSRRAGESIVFPSLNISIQILQIKSSNVRLGIDAPAEIRVYRDEIAPLQDRPQIPLARVHVPRMDHRQRNQLNAAVLALHLVEKQLESGLIEHAQKGLQYGLSILESLGQSADEQSSDGCAGHRERCIEALIVEDDPVEESLLTSFLRLSGFRVETAHDGHAGLAYLTSHPRPDFVLIDMRLPGLNGAALVSAIRNDPKLRGVRIFAVTGSSQEEAGVNVGPGGVDQWFQKPVNPSQLAQAMNAAANN